MKKLTIGIASYNNFPFINALIYEIKSQVERDGLTGQIDFFLCDDASVQKEYELLLKSLPDYITVLQNKTNYGAPSHSRNRIIAAAKTEFIQFIDGDDTFVGNLRDILAELENNDADLLVSRVIRVQREGLRSKSLFMYTDRLFSNFNYSQPDVKKLTVHQAGIWSCYRLTFLKKHRILYRGPMRYEDNLFMTEVHLKNPKIYLFKTQYYGWRINYNSFSFSSKTVPSRVKIYEEILTLLAKNSDAEITPYLYYSIWNLTFVNIARGYPDLPYKSCHTYFKQLKAISSKYKQHIKKWAKKIDTTYIDNYTLFCIKTKQNSFIILHAMRILKKLLQRKNITKALEKATQIFGILPINNKKIFMTSFYGAFNDNTKYLFLEMQNDPKYTNHQFKFAVKDKELYKTNKSFINYKNRLAFFYHHYTAKYVYFNSWHHPMIIKRKGQIWTQLWHGIPYKKIDKDINTYNQIFSIEKRDARELASKRWDYVQSVNTYNTKIFANLFPSVNIIEQEYQKTNWLKNQQKNTVLTENLRQKYDIAENTLLYAPTYRPYKLYIDIKKLCKLINWNNGEKLVIHLHPDLHWQFINEEEIKRKNIRIIRKIPDIQEIILITTGVITDVSSIIYDYQALGKKVLIFFEDEALYQNVHGIYNHNLNIDN